MKLEYVLSTVLTCTGTLGLILFNQIVTQLRKMTESVESLNVKIAVVCDRVESHDKRIEKLESRPNS
jgi:chaperonin cofactor prefoldin